MHTLTIIPGAPKSGTTSLVDSIARSIEEVGYPIGEYIKEPGYLLKDAESKFLARRCIKDLNEYKRRILSHNGFSFDASQAYFTCSIDPLKLEEIRKTYAQINILIMLRNPYDRIRSAYRMDLTNGWVDRNLDHYLIEEINGNRNPYGAGPRYIEESLYSQNINKLLGSIRPDDMKIILYEQYNDVNYITNVLKSQGFPYRMHHIEHSNVSQQSVPPKWISSIKEVVPPSLRQRVRDSAIKQKFKNIIYRRVDTSSWESRLFPIDQIEADKGQLAQYLHSMQKEIIENWKA